MNVVMIIDSNESIVINTIIHITITIITIIHIGDGSSSGSSGDNDVRAESISDDDLRANVKVLL